MDNATVAPQAPRHKGRRAWTNRGMFGSLERRYLGGRLTLEEERQFEDLVRVLRPLHKAASY